MKQTISQQALALVEKRLPSTKGSLSPQDAATATGITVDEARDALTRLMELYVTRVTYDTLGNLLFAFEYPLRRRGTKTFAEQWAGVKETVWRGFKVFFKIWIGMMVIVYFALMVVVLIALVIAQRSSSDSDDDGPGDMLAGLFRVFAEGLQYAFWWRVAAPPVYLADEYGYNYRRVAVPRGAGKAKGKSFIIAIYDLALGPERPSADPLENEKEVAAFLRSERGVLAPAEITALSGASLDAAEERMADYLVRFNGEPAITEEGVVIGEFETFLSGTTSKTDGRIVPYWDEYEAPYEHSGNSSGRNAAIIAMVLFTLVVGVAVIAGALRTLALRVPVFNTGAARFALGYFPVAFSTLYCLISLIRLPDVQRKERQRLERNREKQIARVIFQQRLWHATAPQIHTAANAAGPAKLTLEEVAVTLGALLPKLQGRIELDENGQPIYAFDRLQREIEAAEKKRKG